jgi:hypothetical protein
LLHEESRPGERYDKHASLHRDSPHVILHARHGKESRQREEEMNSAISMFVSDYLSCAELRLGSPNFLFECIKPSDLQG